MDRVERVHANLRERLEAPEPRARDAPEQRRRVRAIRGRGGGEVRNGPVPVHGAGLRVGAMDRLRTRMNNNE